MMQGERVSHSWQQGKGSAARREQTELSFKRFILNQARNFVHEPMADLYRVGLLAQMLDRYDELRAKGLSDESALYHVENEFRDIPERMREEGFDELEAPGHAASASRWPQLSEKEVVQYIGECSDALHHKAIGTALCSACCAPFMAAMAVSDVLWGFSSDAFATLGLVGLFGMIGLGVYSIATASKPRMQGQIKKGRFSLSNSLRKKLTEWQEKTEQKARHRRGKGIALLVTCVVPLFLGMSLSSVWYNDLGAMLGLAGMFGMIGWGVYEVMMGDGEKKPLRRLLDK